MNEQDMVKKLKNDPAALRSVMQSTDGRALLGMLSGGDTAALGRAAQQAAAGDMSGAVRHAPACDGHTGGCGAGTASGRIPAAMMRGGPRHGGAG